MTPVSTRLMRLLNMVPYFQANPRTTYAKAAADLGDAVDHGTEPALGGQRLEAGPGSVTATKAEPTG